MHEYSELRLRSDASILSTPSQDVDSNNDSSSTNGSASSSESTESITQQRDSDIITAEQLTKIAQRPSLLEEDERFTAAATAAATHTSPSPISPKSSKDDPVTWMSLPKKGQLAVLTLARLSEPLSERSLSAYMFYQLRSFDPTLPDSTIASQGGMLTAAFAAAQFITAVWWGRAADVSWIGRKRVLLVGLLGTAVASIGVGFSKTFTQALLFRLLAGALNGNIGVMRTMISEMIQEKKFQSRAFLLLPMCFNIGVVIGPILGGFLADPIRGFPHVFGPGSFLGGKDGVGWMKSFPYAFPNIFSGAFITMSALAIVLGLDETHQILRHKPDHGRRLGKWLNRVLLHRNKPSSYSYTQLPPDDETDIHETSIPMIQQRSDVERTPSTIIEPEPNPRPSQSPFRALLTRNVILTILAHHLLALHVSSFNALIFLFLPSPRPSTQSNTSILNFTGGLGLSSSKVGLATAIIGLIGFPLQILIYPPLNQKLGTLRSYRTFLPFSALAYVLLPFLVLVPTTPAGLVWVCLTAVLACQVLARTFTLTGGVILINNSSPSPAVLGTLHGVAQSASSAARMLGPTVGGWGLGLGLRKNCVGAVWWAMAGLVGLNWALLWCIFEGDGNGGKA